MGLSVSKIGHNIYETLTYMELALHEAHAVLHVPRKISHSRPSLARTVRTAGFDWGFFASVPEFPIRLVRLG